MQSAQYYYLRNMYCSYIVIKRARHRERVHVDIIYYVFISMKLNSPVPWNIVLYN